MKPYVGQIILFREPNSVEPLPAVITGLVCCSSNVNLTLLARSKWGSTRLDVKPDTGQGGWSLTDGDLERVTLGLLDIDVDGAFDDEPTKEFNMPTHPMCSLKVDVDVSDLEEKATKAEEIDSTWPTPEEIAKEMSAKVEESITRELLDPVTTPAVFKQGDRPWDAEGWIPK